MKIKIENAVKRVLALLDEGDEALASRIEYGSAAMPLRELIEGLLPGAVRETVLEADAVEPGDCLMLERIPEAEYSPGGTLRRFVMPLPWDFLRFAAMRMSDWDRTVTVPIVCGGEEHCLRTSPMRGARGRRTRPAVAVVPGKSGRLLEIYGSAPGAVPLFCGYIPEPLPCDDGTIFIPSILVEAALDRCALRVKRIRDQA